MWMGRRGGSASGEWKKSLDLLSKRYGASLSQVHLDVRCVLSLRFEDIRWDDPRVPADLRSLDKTGELRSSLSMNLDS